MSLDNLPVEWLKSSFAHLNDYRANNFNPLKNDETYYELYSVPIFPEGYPEILQAKEIGSSKQIVEKNDILLCKINPRINRVWQVSKHTDYLNIASSEWIVFRQGNVVPKLYRYYFQSLEFRNLLCANVSGVGGSLTRAQPKHVATYDLPVPPLAEQQEIVRQLDIMLAQVEQIKARLDAIPAILKKFRQSILADAVSGKLTEEWREKNAVISTKDLLQQIQAHKKEWVENNADHPESKRIKKRLKEFQPSQTGNALYPKTWHECCLEDIVLMIVDCHNKTAPYVESGIPLIRTSNIRDGKVRWEDLRFVDEPTYEYWSRRAKPESGDLIFTREAPMGEVCIIPDDQIFCLGQRTMLIKPIHELCIKNYLLLNILSDIFKKRNEEFAIGTGVKHYRVGDVSNFKIPLAPLEEQKVIVQLGSKDIGVADHISHLVESAQKRVNLLTQSILAKAFSGELTAEWREQHQELITGVNSAESLLAKIQAEREVNKPVKKAKKVK